MRAFLPPVDYFIGRAVPGFDKYQVVEHHRSGGNAHLFRAYSEELKNAMACKVIPRENLRGRDRQPPTWQTEIHRANTLNHSVAVKVLHMDEWVDKDNGIDCVVFCSDFIPGVDLRQYISQNRGGLSVQFAEDLLKDMLSFFHEMRNRDIVHGDFHAGNILVEDRSEALGGAPYAFRVTDFGVVSATGDNTLLDDYEQLAVVLREVLRNVSYQAASARDRFALRMMEDWLVPRGLLERDVTHEPCARIPKRLYERVAGLDAEFRVIQKQDAAPRLVTPFDYLSCEQIGEDHSLLRSLYSRLFLGLGEIETADNAVVTGPRGCGKSTVFKSLSLRHRVLVDEDTPEKVDYIGAYFRCDDLYFAFPRYELPSRPEAYDLPIHYMTATLLIEVLESLEMWGKKRFGTAFAKTEERAASRIWDVLGLPRPDEPSANRFKTVCARMGKQRKRAADKQRFANDPKQKFGSYFGPRVLGDTCQVLQEELAFLEGRPFFFFVDDYSSPKITLALQENLNRLLMQRASTFFFKLSTESPVSFARGDIDKKVYVENREFTLLNLGVIYLRENPGPKLAFIGDVFARRLKALPDYPVRDLDTLLGAGPGLSFNETARNIIDNRRQAIWGKDSLAQLCSGDIHYVIELVRKMVMTAGGREALAGTTDVPRVSSRVQTEAVRNAAGDFLRNLRSLPNGEQLVEIVSAFGSVAHSYLRYRTSKNQEERPPHQASRIEPYEPLELSAEAQARYNELLRYSVFIEDVRGKSRRGHVVPRLWLRRFLIPHFNLTFNMRDSVQLEADEFEQLLLAPREFEKAKRLKTPVAEEDDDDTPRPPERVQQELFGETEKGDG